MQGAGKKMVKRSASLQLNKLEEVKNWVKLSFNLLGKDYKAELAKARDFIELDKVLGLRKLSLVVLSEHVEAKLDPVFDVVDLVQLEAR